MTSPFTSPGPDLDNPGSRADSRVIHATLIALAFAAVWIGRQFADEATAPGGLDSAPAEQLRRMQWVLAADLD